ncbi:DVU_1556 family methyltransferase [Pseudodesulfovibrio sp. zrk46]|uniref:DVU_1556 family methyltransferase n=1 Tax=Pseudodesulfovibrio sp. zrk46 TaxID=2725288 RepID=UPI0014496C1F|nr:class I SAM-dependent methyltransferase [Pseudodesulfovibrio sp. zrk46]QJB57420.1 methyltransferase domain-containing protein [Pseudodesulfovibrio sp. zrk46]
MRETIPLWERPILHEVAGGTLHPGGFTLTDRAAEFIGVLPGWNVLDVGCGLGTTVSRLRSRFGARAFGIEASLKQIERAQGLPGIAQAQGDALPFGDGVFSAVFCECVLSLLQNPHEGVAEFFRVLQPGGYLALSDLCASGSPILEFNSCAARAIPLDEIPKVIEGCGFVIMNMENHTRLLTDLAARLLLAGGDGADCGCGRQGLGYFLMIARKEG